MQWYKCHNYLEEIFAMHGIGFSKLHGIGFNKLFGIGFNKLLA